MTPAPAAEAAKKTPKYPLKAAYVIVVEGAERYSYYGMVAILTLYMTQKLDISQPDAVARFGYFNALVYLAPLLGGWLSDRYIGRYKTILWVSFGYVGGHAVLALWPGITGLYVGCLLIALGAGGIKPCVSAFMADQFEPGQEHLIEGAYGWFYLSINVGSTFGIFMVPLLRDNYGYHVAFAAPGVAMAIALMIYVSGRKLYRKLSPSGATNDGFVRVLTHAATHTPPAGKGRLDGSAPPFPQVAVDGVKATFRIAFVFLFISMFWALFFQYGSSWALQAEAMNRVVGSFTMSPEHLSLLNSVFVIGLIPIMNVIYARLTRRGVNVTPLGKMKLGMFIAALAFAAAFVVQYFMDRGDNPHALWQSFQYFFLSLAEVLISVTGLEFAYTQAPPSMKSAIMAVWFLCISVGGLLTGAMANAFGAVFGAHFDWKLFYGIFFIMMLAAAIAFTFVARWYKPLFGPGSPRDVPA